jgi:hypothetical protein
MIISPRSIIDGNATLSDISVAGIVRASTAPGGCTLST